MKIFLTEFTYEGKDYVGPKIIAKNYKDAELQAEHYEVFIVGMLDMIFAEDSFEEWNRVLH
jgi:hypothetical protein|tara:strand:- start:120 stop:302 length:183 start_codon:yes stop_codon:yes gene_type:complete